MNELGQVSPLGATVDPRIDTAEAARIANPADKAAVMQGAKAQQPQLPPEPSPEAMLKGAQGLQGVMAERTAQGEKLLSENQAPKPPTKEELSIHPEQAQLLFPMMLSLAALAGKRTSEPMTAAMNNMTAVMKAQVEGNNEFVAHHEKQMMDSYKAAKDAHNETMKTLDPKIKDLLSATPNALEELRLALYAKGYDPAVVEKLLGDGGKNFFAQHMAQEKYMAGIQKHMDVIEERKREFNIREARMALRNKGLSEDDVAKRIETYRSTRDPKDLYAGLSGAMSGARSQVSAALGDSDIDPSGTSSARLALKGSAKEVQVLSQQKANLDRIERALTEKDGIGDQVVAASKKIDPSKLRQYNKISQFLQKEQSDPDLAAYRTKLLALRDEYASVITKGSVQTDASRQQASEIMDQYSPSNSEALVKAVKEVTLTNKRAADNAINAATHHRGSSVDPTAGWDSDKKARFEDFKAKHAN